MVAYLSVDSNDVGFFMNSAIASLQLGGVETVFLVDFFSFSIKPFVPDLHVELDHGIRLLKVLGVRHDEVVVTFQNMDGVVSEVSGHIISKESLVGLDIFLRVQPLVMRRNVTGPHDHIRIDL